MDTTSILDRLTPSIPEMDQILNKIREKYNIPPVLPENVQLAETLFQERTVEEWEAIRQEIEDELRAWFRTQTSSLDDTLNLFMAAINKTPEIKTWMTSEKIGVKEEEAAKFLSVMNQNANDGIKTEKFLFFTASQKVLDHLITGRPLSLLPEIAINPVITLALPPDGEKIVIAIAHQLSDPDKITEKFHQKVVEAFREKPKINEADLETADYLAMRNTDKSISEIIDIMKERHPNLIPYKKGTKKYDDALRKLKDTTRQRLYRLQQDVNQIVGRDRK